MYLAIKLKQMKLKENAQIKLSNSFEDASRIVEKLKSLGFNAEYYTSEEWWNEAFMKDRMNLTLFQNGNMHFANHNALLYKVYDNLDEFLASVGVKSLLTGKAKEDFDKWWIVMSAYPQSPVMAWLTIEGIIPNIEKLNGLHRLTINGDYIFDSNGEVAEFDNINDALDVLVKLGCETYNGMHI